MMKKIKLIFLIVQTIKFKKNIQYDNLEKYYQESNELNSNRIDNNNIIND